MTPAAPTKTNPGDSPEHPMPAIRPDELKKGWSYEGWTCKNAACGKRVELIDVVSDTAPPAEERLWMKCAHCGAVELYQLDRTTIQEYG
jgi:hypothetical protein